MPIYSNEIIDSASSIDDKFTRDSSRTYKVIASVDMEAFQVRAAFPIQINTPHPTDPGQVALKVSAQLAEKKRGTFSNPMGAGDGQPIYVWHVTVTYGPWNPIQHSTDDNPLNQPPKVYFTTVTVEKPVEFDINGNPIVNSAGDPFDPPPTEEVTHFIMNVMRNEKLDASDLFAIMDISQKSRTNNATWNTFPEKTVRTLPINIPEEKYYQGYSDSFPGAGFLYREMLYQFEINPDTWNRKFLDLGFRRTFVTGGVTERTQIIDAGGVPVSTPSLLDGSGQPLPLPVDHTSAVTLDFETLQPIDYGVFGMDTLIS